MRILTVCLALIEDISEKEKFEQLYWQYKDLMFYCAHKRLHDVQLAEDAVNISFLHAAKNMSMVGEVASARTKRLMVTIAERTAINLYHKAQKEYNRTVRMEDVESMVCTSEESDRMIAEAILELPLPYRQAIVLKYSQGYNNREIAAILDCSVAKVEKLLARGKKQLAKQLEEV